eukprot:scaffold18596_cov51-Skeletonema_marinoi.AAC.1
MLELSLKLSLSVGSWLKRWQCAIPVRVLPVKSLFGRGYLLFGFGFLFNEAEARTPRATTVEVVSCVTFTRTE